MFCRFCLAQSATAYRISTANYQSAPADRLSTIPVLSCVRQLLIFIRHGGQIFSLLVSLDCRAYAHFQLSTINYQLFLYCRAYATINYQLSTINYHLFLPFSPSYNFHTGSLCQHSFVSTSIIVSAPVNAAPVSRFHTFPACMGLVSCW